MRKKSTINFNHISKDISADDKQKLTELYKFYHKLSTCYKWKYKKIRKIVLMLNMLGIGLTCVGAVVGGITLNPIVIGALTSVGVLINGYMVKSNMPRSVEKCRYAYTNYKKILIKLRNALRGVDMDEGAFLAELKIIDDIVTDTCPDIDGLSLRYEKTFDIGKV